MRHAAIASTIAALLAAAPAFAEGEEKPEPEYPEFDPQVKDMTAAEGFLRLYRKAKEETLLATVPAALLDKPFFLATSISGGTEYAGWQWSDKLVRLEQRNKQLLLVELDVHQRAKEGTPLHEVVRRTFADRLLATIDIKGVAPDGALLVDLGRLLAGEQATFFGMFSLDDSVARWTKVKAFPQNVEIAVQMPLRGDGTFVTLHYSISELPPLEDYAPRRADDRIGYFVTAIRDYTEGDADEGRMLRLVNRWKLEKADPALAMSPAKEPIVFYIEKTVPVAFRRAVAEGIAEWNRAFEAVGIHDAIVVRQQTESQFQDLDPEDVRYNFFRWITSESAFAMGPSRVDPRTGRILDADIIFDDSMLRGSLRDYDVMIREAPGKLLGRSMTRWLERHPEQHPMARFRDLAVQDPVSSRARALVREVARELPELRDALAVDGVLQPAATRREVLAMPDVVRKRAEQCQVGEGLPHQMALLRLVLGGLADTAPGGLPGLEGFVSEVVKETVMHEVGHTLGLRHNFKASSMLELDAINAPERPAATSASVMDYHPLNIALGSERPQGHYVPSTIGPYDMLAIQYGYALVEEGSDDLKAIPRKMAEQGLPYGTDEDAGSPDPLITRWDMGKDPVAFARYRRQLVLKLWEGLETRAVADDGSYSRLRRAFDMTIFELGMSSSFVARQVGGLGFARDHRGDKNARPPITVIDAKAQRDALTWVCQNVFQDANWAVPAGLQAKLAAGRWSHWGSNDEGASLDYSYLDRVAQVQGWSLFFLTADDTLARLWENEQRVGAEGDALTLPELFDTLEASLFGELGRAPAPEATPRQPVVSTLRQNLQDAYVRRLIAIALGNGVSPPVANKLAWSRLKALESRFRGLLDQRLDAYTRAHLESLEQKSNQARTADYVHIASGGCALSTAASPAPAAALALGLFALGLALARRRATAFAA